MCEGPEDLGEAGSGCRSSVCSGVYSEWGRKRVGGVEEVAVDPRLGSAH